MNVLKALVANDEEGPRPLRSKVRIDRYKEAK